MEPGHEYLVMASHLPLRKNTSTVRFFRGVWAVRRQLAGADGLVGYTLRAKPFARDYWTLSVWNDQASLRAFMRSGAGRPQPYGRVPLLVDWRLELVQVPVSDVDRAKTFYTEKAGFNADHDHRVSDEIRFVQLTPPGSACSIALGTGLGGMPPGSVQGLQLVVPDIDAARAELLDRGVEVSEVQKFDWGSFVFFSDPDGNGWAVQQIPARH
jgi:predicted enzyme related to lactoylglutathione lyase